MLGDCHVVRQARARQFDRYVVAERARGIDHAVPHVRVLVAVVEIHQLAGVLVDLGVRGETVAGLAHVLRRGAQGFQCHGVDDVRNAREIPRGHRLAAVRDDVGVGAVLEAQVVTPLERAHDAPER